MIIIMINNFDRSTFIYLHVDYYVHSYVHNNLSKYTSFSNSTCCQLDWSWKNLTPKKIPFDKTNSDLQVIKWSLRINLTFLMKFKYKP